MPAAGGSTKVQVIAILNLVGGFLGLLGSLFTGFGLIILRSAPGGPFGGGGGPGGPPGSIDSVELQKYLERNVPGYAAIPGE